MAIPAKPLLEREGEQERTTQLLAGLTRGTGGLLLLEGAAGLGKTTLLEAIVERARGGEIEIYRARGTELERTFAFGIARQLFEPKLAAQDPAAREQALGGAAALALPAVTAGVAGEAASSFSVLHGLYWLLLQLANQAPTLLVLDDLHWADRPSLEWLDYLLNRIAELPVLVVAATRPFQPSSDAGERPHALWTDTAVERLRLAPLGQSSVALLLQQRLEPEPDDAGKLLASAANVPAPAFVAACHQASGGNPFLLRELLDTVSARRLPMTAAAAGEVAALASEDLVRRTHSRLAELGADATAVGRALATLEHGAEVRQLAAVAELSHDCASEALDMLVEAELAGVARPARIVHPLIRTAILDGLPPGLRSDLHARAAEVLLDDGGDPERIAAHLLECDPAENSDRVGLLRRAAAIALRRGSPANAVTFLRRALAEPPGKAQRATVLRELGEAELLGRHPQAIAHLQSALELAEDRQARVEIGCRLGDALIYVGELDDGIAAFRRARALLPVTDRPEMGARIDAQVLALTALNGREEGPTSKEAEEDQLARARDPSPANRPLAMTVALVHALRGECEEVPTIVGNALAGGRFLAAETADSMAAVLGADALIFVDRLADSLTLTRAMIADGQRRGSVLGVVAGSTHCAFAELRMGALADAEADARAAFELARQHGLSFTLPFIVAHLSLAMLDRGDGEGALDTLESIELDPSAMNPPAHHTFLEARARVRLERGQREQAIADLYECREQTRAVGCVNPSVCGWRTLLVDALAGELRAEAHVLAAEDLALARRCGSARSEGIALRALARLADPSQRIEPLRASVRILRTSPARLELARSLLELGAELVRKGQRVEARELLLESLHLAHECGATPLAEQALECARAAGARPRRLAISGRDSLTAAELRVARMAAEGSPNREIAQALFITTRTVKAHLTSTYRKLDISTRKHLAPALTDSPG
jgi:DNA-binding CsgD family transcriptional regulator